MPILLASAGTSPSSCPPRALSRGRCSPAMRVRGQAATPFGLMASRGSCRIHGHGLKRTQILLNSHVAAWRRRPPHKSRHASSSQRTWEPACEEIRHLFGSGPRAGVLRHTSQEAPSCSGTGPPQAIPARQGFSPRRCRLSKTRSSTRAGQILTSREAIGSTSALYLKAAGARPVRLWRAEMPKMISSRTRLKKFSVLRWHRLC